MSRIISTEAGEVVTQSRTCEIRIIAEYKQPYVVVINRETIKTVKGELLEQKSSTQQYQIVVAERIGQNITAAGLTVSLGQLAALVAKFTDDIDEELTKE